jgi:hypothetical protein
MVNKGAADTARTAGPASKRRLDFNILCPECSWSAVRPRQIAVPVQIGVYDAFSKRLADTADPMKVADGFKPGVVIGPLVDMKPGKKVEAHIADVAKKGPRSSPAASGTRWAAASSNRPS